MTTINKICIDSRFRVSGTNTDFRVELPESVLLPERSACMITDISIPHSWYSIDNNNCRLYLRLDRGGTLTDTWVSLSSKNYDIDSLAQEIQTTLTVISASFTATAQAQLGVIFITHNASVSTFRLLTDAELLTSLAGGWTGAPYDTRNPFSCNNVLGNVEPQINTPLSLFRSGFVDTLSHHNIYITSPNLGSFQNYGPRGERNILKKVVVDVPFGSVVVDTLLNTDDYTECSKQLLKTLDFKVCDVYGPALELHGASVSFSIVFKSI